MKSLEMKHTKIEQDKHLKKNWEDKKGLCKAYWSMSLIASGVLWVLVGPVVTEAIKAWML